MPADMNKNGCGSLALHFARRELEKHLETLFITDNKVYMGDKSHGRSLESTFILKTSDRSMAETIHAHLDSVPCSRYSDPVEQKFSV